MMSPNCFICPNSHKTDRTDIPMIKQGFTESKRTIIGNDLWIDRDVIMSPRRYISDGTIVGMRTVLIKDFPPYSVVGGAPCRLLKNRKQKNEIDENRNIDIATGN